MKEKTYMLFIIALLQMGLVCNCQLACAKPLPADPNNIIDKPIIDHNKPVDSNQSAFPKDADSSKLTIDELRVEIYKEGIECFRREMGNYKWVIDIALVALGIIVAIIGIGVAIAIHRLSNRVGTTEEEVEITELWNKAGVAYGLGHFEDAITIWGKINKKYKPNTRQFFNNWGSSLLNFAKQRTGEEKKRLLLEAAEKYKKAEEFTRGIMAYNLASIYSLLNKKDECNKWLEVAKETGRMLPKAKFERDDDFENMWGEPWYEKFKNDLLE
jgi:tetratricopeptide (TPR) repeat protein